MHAHVNYNKSILELRSVEMCNVRNIQLNPDSKLFTIVHVPLQYVHYSTERRHLDLPI